MGRGGSEGERGQSPHGAVRKVTRVFHTSPASNRDSILEHGLRPAAALAGMNATGVYLWADLDKHWELIASIVVAEGFEENERPFDLWQVDVSGLEFERDRSVGPREYEAYFVAGAIGPARLALQASFDTVAAYLGVADLDSCAKNSALSARTR
jgi:hypothetical protein